MAHSSDDQLLEFIGIDTGNGSGVFFAALQEVSLLKNLYYLGIGSPMNFTTDDYSSVE